MQCLGSLPIWDHLESCSRPLVLPGAFVIHSLRLLGDVTQHITCIIRMQCERLCHERSACDTTMVAFFMPFWKNLNLLSPLYAQNINA